MCFQIIGIFQRFGETWAIINLQDKSEVGLKSLEYFNDFKLYRGSIKSLKLLEVSNDLKSLFRLTSLFK